MIEPWLKQLAPRVDGSRALAAVEAIALHHRIQSSPGYEDAARWLGEALSGLGLEVEIETVPADGVTRYLGMPMPEGWRCERADATLALGTQRIRVADFAAQPLSIVQRSAPARGAYPVVGVAGGDRARHYEGVDVGGKVVLCSAPVQRVHALAVVERGAAGVLFDGRRLFPPVRTAGHDRDSLAYTSFWWQGGEPRGWGVVLSPATGATVREHLAAGGAASLEIDLASARYAGGFSLVSATLPGEWPGEVLVTAHLCHPRPGANDNASGAAAALESARALAALAAAGGLPRARRTLRWLWMPEFTGSYAWIGRNPVRAARTVAALNLDMVGEDQAACGSTQVLERAPHFAGSFADELVARIRHAAGGTDGPARAAEAPFGGGSDHAVWSDPAIGVPCPMLIQWPDRYYHSDLDTPERCDPASLAQAARIAATYAATIATAGPRDIAGLLESGARAGRQRLLLALEAPGPEAAVRSERLRAQLALASVARLAHGASPDGELAKALRERLPAVVDELEGFHDAEIRPALRGAQRGAPPAPRGRRPARLPGATLLPIRSLLPGWPDLAAAERESFWAFEDAFPGGPLGMELGWFACDGRRDSEEIAALLRDEGIEASGALVEGLFGWTARLGLSRWQVDEARP